jgi:hypothetical protein
MQDDVKTSIEGKVAVIETGEAAVAVYGLEWLGHKMLATMTFMLNLLFGVGTKDPHHWTRCIVFRADNAPTDKFGGAFPWGGGVVVNLHKCLEEAFGQTAEPETSIIAYFWRQVLQTLLHEIRHNIDGAGHKIKEGLLAEKTAQDYEVDALAKLAVMADIEPDHWTEVPFLKRFIPLIFEATDLEEGWQKRQQFMVGNNIFYKLKTEKADLELFSFKEYLRLLFHQEDNPAWDAKAKVDPTPVVKDYTGKEAGFYNSFSEAMAHEEAKATGGKVYAYPADGEVKVTDYAAEQIASTEPKAKEPAQQEAYEASAETRWTDPMDYFEDLQPETELMGVIPELEALGISGIGEPSPAVQQTASVQQPVQQAQQPSPGPVTTTGPADVSAEMQQIYIPESGKESVYQQTETPVVGEEELPPLPFSEAEKKKIIIGVYTKVFNFFFGPNNYCKRVLHSNIGFEYPDAVKDIPIPLSEQEQMVVLGTDGYLRGKVFSDAKTPYYDFKVYGPSGEVENRRLMPQNPNTREGGKLKDTALQARGGTAIMYVKDDKGWLIKCIDGQWIKCR